MSTDRNMQRPSGWEYVTVGDVQYLLPPKVAAEHRARSNAVVVGAARENAPENAKIQSASGKPPVAPPPVSAEPEVAYKRSLPDNTSSSERVYVIPNLRDLREDDEALRLRTPDLEVRMRLKAVRERVLALGARREFARRYDWPEALDQIEAEMPNFRAPIQLVRNTLNLIETTDRPIRVPPMLLVGPPGLGKTLFSRKLADALGAPMGAIAFDQPSAGTQLSGSDAHWSNTQSGMLFQMICLGSHANPVILLDEIEKASVDGGSRNADPLSQLHSALEPETSCRSVDLSTGICFDASYATYIATANSLGRIGLPILSRFEIFHIEHLQLGESFQVAGQVVAQVLKRLKLDGRLRVHRRGLCVLSHLTPRMMHRAVEKAIAAAVMQQKLVVDEDDVWKHAGLEERAQPLH